MGQKEAVMNGDQKDGKKLEKHKMTERTKRVRLKNDHRGVKLA